MTGAAGPERTCQSRSSGGAAVGVGVRASQGQARISAVVVRVASRLASKSTRARRRPVVVWSV